MGGVMFYGFPLHINPPQQYDYASVLTDSERYNFYPFRWGGWLETSWITLNLYDVEKFFYSVSVAIEDYNDDIPVYIDYKTDDDSSWTPISTATTSWDDEVEISTDYSISGKRIKLRIRIEHSDFCSETPTIVSTRLGLSD
jgi:hypothetical protein